MEEEERARKKGRKLRRRNTYILLAAGPQPSPVSQLWGPG
jgi:hypothetical protein